MKNYILTILCTVYTSFLLGQVNEIGVFLGGSNYVGDVGKNYFIYPDNPSAAIFFKHNWNPRIAFRATYSYLPIQGDDADADTGFRKDRALPSFENTIHELALGIEYNFYEYNIAEPGKTWTPYILLEIAGFNYQNVQSHTVVTGAILGNKTAIAIPFGIGFKSKLYEKIAFAIETKFRYTFEDDLDYISNTTPNVNLEGTGNDWYMFSGISITYTFGRPPCYKDGF